VPHPQPEPHAAAEALQGLIGALFPALHAGAALPAHGDDRACAYCEMRGLCRKDWHA
jgi:ATP-dependent helicase/nuclease subunit B